jgi:hypothetical protein
MLFSLYVAPLEDVIQSHGLDMIMYGDDSQIYIFMRESDRHVALDTLHLCVKDIMNWNIHNMLKFNPTKTDIVHITSRFQATTQILSFAGGDHMQPITKEAKDLGVIIDSNLTMKSHIDNYTMHDIR